MSASQVRELRDRTGAGIMDCKRALEEAGGDLDKAVAILRERGLASAEKKSGRRAAEGLIVSYIHSNNRFGSLVELNCETDFVARTEDFAKLAQDIALHVVGMNPRYVSEDEITDEERAAGIDEFGSEEAFLNATVIMRQPFVRDSSTTVEEMIREAIGRIGENIVLRRFVRYELGELSEEEAGEEE
ncbi:MAG TPA: translation elongation factor Ts [Thermomicrobiales bacterium]|nr:translation elongation factor Ts [Thermomicrobiales bacterium]